MKETWIWSLGQEDPLENEIQPTSVFLPGKSHGQRSLAGYSLWGHKELDMTEQLNNNNGRLQIQASLVPTVYAKLPYSSVHFNRSVVSDSLRLHEPQHARPPCPSPTAGVYPNPCPLSQWCHPTMSSSVVPFSFCPQSFPASGSLQMSQLFASGGQSIGVSASTSVLPKNTQDWSPLGRTGWISLQSKGLSRVFSNTTVQKNQFFCTQLSL